MGALMHCIGEVGLRVPEALALQWNDVDLDTGWAIVRRSISSGGRVQSPRQMRVITLFPETVDRLGAISGDPSGYVFAPAGRVLPVSATWVQHQWRAIQLATAFARQGHRPRDSKAFELHSLHQLRYHAVIWMLTAPPFGPGFDRESIASQLGVDAKMLEAILLRWRPVV